MTHHWTIRRAGHLMLLLIGLCPTLPAQHDCLHHKRSNGQAKGGGGGVLHPMDLLHQRIHLDLTAANTITARCDIQAVPRTDGLDQFTLDLAGLTVDSVTTSGGALVFTHAGELLTIDLPAPLTTSDTIDLTVHYHGTPITDPSGFGGFYFSGNYRYNLGVAFTSVPHSYGRILFPCADNFTERSTYEFIVRTNGGRNAWCNGVLVGETALGGDTLERHWLLEQAIPSYLASVAANTYVSARDTFPSITGVDVPVDLVALPQDTTNLKNSFIRLKDSFDHFENWFGPYRWDRVGYVVTPIGAMEHATSIHYPASIVNGNTNYEHIMAHELAHHWWGNLVTCDRAEEMYINEGFAEYLSYLFLEHAHGRDRYMNEFRSNHRKMVHRAHLLDGGWWALSEVPQEWTYGEHSYNKGADALHSLRGYLGDALFIEGLTSFLGTYAFQPVNTLMLRDHLTAVTGVDMAPYFSNVVQQPGWAAFEVDSFTVVPGDVMYMVTVHVQQKARGPAEYHQQVPLHVSFMDADGTFWQAPDSVLVGGATSTFEMVVPFDPVSVVLNPEERISLAITVDSDTLEGPGINQYSHADIRLTVANVPEPVPVRIEEYWVAADPEVDDPSGIFVSPDRWWRIVGRFPEGTEVSGRIQYDGRSTATTSYDHGLVALAGGTPFVEDSLVLLYRPDQRAPWTVHPNFTLNTLTSPTDLWGRVEFTDVQPGEYTLGWRHSAVGIDDLGAPAAHWTIHPNPAHEVVTITRDHALPAPGMLQLIDGAGRLAQELRWQGPTQMVDVSKLVAGTYTVRFVPHGGEAVRAGQVVVAR
ncbi:MAG: M1 family aminopeptidase [Flavobacteriales bacterium]|jgi:aminopeptidase N|nr:M1 family aminopeptidase [Flavobacteriales bacterium]